LAPHNQQDYLSGVTLTRRPWQQTRAGWDHDHCEFCWEKFGPESIADVLHEGWTTSDEYRRIWDTCFRDFCELFKWQIV
jgi:hypothetical protein